MLADEAGEGGWERDNHGGLLHKDLRGFTPRGFNEASTVFGPECHNGSFPLTFTEAERA